MYEDEVLVDIMPMEEPDEEDLQAIFAAALASVTGRYDDTVAVPTRRAPDPF